METNAYHWSSDYGLQYKSCLINSFSYFQQNAILSVQAKSVFVLIN